MAIDEDAVAAARTQARRRLVGAFVLLAAGVIGFPLLFDTQPRPLSPQLPIIAAQGESQRSRADAAARVASPPARSERLAASASSAPAAAAAAVPAPAPASAPSSQPAAAAGASKPAGAAVAAVQPSSGAALASAPALPPRATASAPKPPAAASASISAAPTPPAAPTRPPVPPPARPPEPPATEGRFAVQVGAYSDTHTLRETRQRVEKLGLRTYTQAIEGDASKRTRVRVGPFATREQAQAAAAKLKAAGLPANLLTL